MGSVVSSGECVEQDTINISQETVSEWLFTTTDTFMITIIIPIIWCLGILNNLSFLFVLFRVPSLRTDINIYLANLAVADLLFLNLESFLEVWRYAVSPLVQHDPLSSSAQHVSFNTIINLGYFASIALVTMVSFERYLALCHPVKHLNYRGRRRTHRMVAICWLVGFLFSLSTMMRRTVPILKCLRWPDDDVYQGYPSTIAYFDPPAHWVPYLIEPLLNVPWLIAMFANTCMYVRIILTLNKRTGDNGLVSNDPNAIQLRNQVAKMLIVNGVVFFLCQFPYRVVSLAWWICLMAQIPDPLESIFGRNRAWIAIVPELCNTAINPLIYGIMNRTYRAGFSQSFRCKGQPRQQYTPPDAECAIDGNDETKL